jgi:hypothetical protein
MAQAQAITATPISAATCYNISQNLGVGLALSNQNAQALVQDLVKAKFWNPTVLLTSYNANVMMAVQAFQKTYASELLTPYGLVYPSGNVDTATRTKLNNLYGCGSDQALPTNNTSGTVSTGGLPVGPSTAACPAGYVCTPINPIPGTVLCPIGFVCTPTANPTNTTPTNTNTNTSNTVPVGPSFTTADAATIQSGGTNQFGQTTSLVATFQIPVTARGGTMQVPAYDDITVVFKDAAGNSYTAPSTSINVSPNGAITENSSAVITVTASIPASSLPASGLYYAAITSFRWNVNGNMVTQTYGLENLRTTSSVNFVK